MRSDVLITGGTGMVGSAIKSFFPMGNYISSKDFDLRSYSQTKAAFEKYNPRYVIHLAAKVGGVKGNSDNIADFFDDNIMINTNVLKCATEFKVKKTVSMLSTCVYPDKNYVTYPLTEDQLHMGPPHKSNFGYAYAKRMLDVQSRTHRKQHGSNFICAIPNNLFGPNDYFDLEKGHVIPCIIRKIWEAKHERKSCVLWGDGSPLREFTYSKDIARALLFLLFTVEQDLEIPVNIGNTKEHSIKDIANKIAKILDYSGLIVWDSNMPKGQHRKPSSSQKFADMGFNLESYTSIDDALEETCEWFAKSYPFVRGVEK